MKNKKKYIYLALTTIIAFSTLTSAMAANEIPGVCTVTYGTKASEWFTIAISPDTDGNFPYKSSAFDENGNVVSVGKYEYQVLTDAIYGPTGSNGKFNASEYYQTLPGLGKTEFKVYPSDTFPSVQFNGPGEGPDNNEVCFSQLVFERSLVNYLSNPSGPPQDPPKFSVATNQFGVGLTSMLFNTKSGWKPCLNDFGGGIAGPDYGDDYLIKPTVKWLLFGTTKVRFEIDYQNCTYKAYQETSGGEIPLDQYPQDNISITIGGDTGSLEESNSPGKCNELGSAFGSGTCYYYLLGGSYVKIPVGCKP